MITVYGEGRGFRVVWLLEEMSLPYRLRRVDLLAGVEHDAEFLAINPSGFIPALQDGEVVMVESVAIMQYLLARYGPTSCAPTAADPSFARFQQFMHLGEAGLMMPMYVAFLNQRFAPPEQRGNWCETEARGIFCNRLKLVSQQLRETPFLAGERFTAADISVTYALEFAQRTSDIVFDEVIAAYVQRTTARDGYQRAMAACHETRAWVERLKAQSPATQRPQHAPAP